MRRIRVVALLALLSASCLGSDFADSIEGSWELTAGSVEGSSIPILDSHPITITFDQGQVSGTAACNHYGGTVDIDGSSIAFADLAMTEMACMPPSTMEAEQLYASGLTVVDTITLDGPLTLSGPGVELVFEPVGEPEPTG